MKGLHTVKKTNDVCSGDVSQKIFKTRSWLQSLYWEINSTKHGRRHHLIKKLYRLPGSDSRYPGSPADQCLPTQRSTRGSQIMGHDTKMGREGILNENVKTWKGRLWRGPSSWMAESARRSRTERVVQIFCVRIQGLNVGDCSRRELHSLQLPLSLSLCTCSY